MNFKWCAVWGFECQLSANTDFQTPKLRYRTPNYFTNPKIISQTPKRRKVNLHAQNPKFQGKVYRHFYILQIEIKVII